MLNKGSSKYIQGILINNCNQNLTYKYIKESCFKVR
uniref:Uncharacterized protein n=1 Tax=Arundo donax TaxID=35708 RepID=A0A0A9G3V2_ARUDO